MAVWAFGDDSDATCDTSCWEPTKPTTLRPSAIAFMFVLRAMLEGPATKHELSEASGLHINTINRVIPVLFRYKAAHVAEWDRSTRIPRPAFGLGDKRNAPRPAPQPNAQVMRRYRDRKAARVGALAANSSVFNFAQSA
jgi:hypothetical protein